MEDFNIDENEKREYRKKNRKSNERKAYATLCVALCVLIVGIVFASLGIRNLLQDSEYEEEEITEQLDNLTEEEEKIEIPSEELPIPELTPEEKLDEIIVAAIEAMPLEDRVAGLFLVSPEGLTGVDNVTRAGETTQVALTQYAVGGIVYFEKNMRSKEKFQEMVQNTVAYSKYPLFLAVDEEGGTVSRLAKAGLIDAVDSNSKVAESNDPQSAKNVGIAIANGMNMYGLNLNLAPVADLNNIEKSAIGDRSYGSDPAVVGSMAASMVCGLQENGISACLKHFPGIGSTTQDTHKGMATTERTAEDFRNQEFLAFKTAMDAGADFVMVGHISAPSLTGDKTPCSLSKVVVTDILRNELGYQGVIISDAFNMTSITEYYTSEEASVLALKAGCDMILMPENFKEAYEGVLRAVENGTISEQRINDSLKRIYRIKYQNKLEMQ